MIDLQNKTALITGSSRGIGQQIALGLAQKGCAIIVHGRTKDNCNKTLELLKDFNVRVDVVCGDLSKEKEVLKVIEEVKLLPNTVDILYNNAAIMTPYLHNFYTHTWEQWMQSMKVNVFSLYTLCSAFLPAMEKQNFGRVINLVSGIQDQPELLPYSCSKAAVAQLTKDLAVKFENTNVKINALDPTWLQTDLGGEYADNPVEAVLPGAIHPALIPSDGPNGITFNALSSSKIKK